MKTPAQTPTQIERIIQAGLLMLVGLMPFHAFLSVWLGHLTGHQALIQAWKEVLLLGLMIGGMYLAWRDRAHRQRLLTPWLIAAGIFAVVGLLVTGVAHAFGQLPLTTAVFGIKTDLELLIAGALATLVASPSFGRRLIQVAAATGLGVAGFAVLQATLLPPDFLAQFGYGPTTILPSLYLTGTASALRFGSTLGGPNQLGAYLIMVSCLTLAAIRHRRWMAIGLPVIGEAAYTTYSRSAWIGLVFATGGLIISWLPRHQRRLGLLGAALCLAIATLVSGVMIAESPSLQQTLLHATIADHANPGTSDAQHAASITASLRVVLHAPLGHGLGSAGPATFHAGHSNIIENQYLQVAYETGWLGLGLYLAIFGVLVWQLWRHSNLQPASRAVAAAIAGICLAAIFWPAWTDSTTALVTFTLAGALSGVRRV